MAVRSAIYSAIKRLRVPQGEPSHKPMHTPDAPSPGVADAAAELAALRAENKRLLKNARRWRRRAIRARERLREALNGEGTRPTEAAMDGEGALARVLDAFCWHPDAQRATTERARWDGGRTVWDEIEGPWARLEGGTAWAVLIVRHATPSAVSRALGVPLHVAWAAAERAARREKVRIPCDACAVPCEPVEIRGFSVCRSCRFGDPRKIPGWALLSWAWRYLRDEKGRPPTKAELRAFAPKNYNTLTAWWEVASPALAEWRRVEAMAGEILLEAIPPRNDREENLLTLRDPR